MMRLIFYKDKTNTTNSPLATVLNLQFPSLSPQVNPLPPWQGESLLRRRDAV